MNKLTIEDVKRKLSDYELSKGELEEIKKELNEILNEVEKQIEIENIHEEYKKEREYEDIVFEQEDFM